MQKGIERLTNTINVTDLSCFKKWTFENSLEQIHSISIHFNEKSWFEIKDFELQGCIEGIELASQDTTVLPIFWQPVILIQTRTGHNKDFIGWWPLIQGQFVFFSSWAFLWMPTELASTLFSLSIRSNQQAEHLIPKTSPPQNGHNSRVLWYMVSCDVIDWNYRGNISATKIHHIGGIILLPCTV